MRAPGPPPLAVTCSCAHEEQAVTSLFAPELLLAEGADVKLDGERLAEAEYLALWDKPVRPRLSLTGTRGAVYVRWVWRELLFFLSCVGSP